MRTTVYFQLIWVFCLVLVGQTGWSGECLKSRLIGSCFGSQVLTGDSSQEESEIPSSLQTQRSQLYYEPDFDPYLEDLRFEHLISRNILGLFKDSKAESDLVSFENPISPTGRVYVAVQSHELFKYMSGKINSDQMQTLLKARAMAVCQQKGFENADLSSIRVSETLNSISPETHEVPASFGGCLSVFTRAECLGRRAFFTKVNPEVRLLREALLEPYDLICEPDFDSLGASQKIQFRPVEIHVPHLLISNMGCY